MANIAIIGAGPAGLACAERLTELAAQHDLDMNIHVFEQMPSAGRKFLMAGKTGLNISHSEDFETFVQRYDQPAWLRPMLEKYHAKHIQQWMKGLGIEPYIGSSGRLFPKEMKAAPLLRAWLQRLRQRGVQFFYRHRVLNLRQQQLEIINLVHQTSSWQQFDVIVLACGAVSWSKLGSDGVWQQWLNPDEIEPFQPSNVGVLLPWSEFMQQYLGQPLKRICAWTTTQSARMGEMVISHYGLEGGLVYHYNRSLRQQLADHTTACLYIDLLPDISLTALTNKLQQEHKQSLTTRWRKVGLDKSKIALLREVVAKQSWHDNAAMAQYIKQLPLYIQGFRPIEEAISCAGGVRQEALYHLQFSQHVHIFACGEMLNWDAPTGGYLLTACMATGRQVAEEIILTQ